MMEALFSRLERLSMLVMLLALCDLLLPEGALRRYARLCGGLVMMLWISSLLLSWLSEGAA